MSEHGSSLLCFTGSKLGMDFHIRVQTFESLDVALKCSTLPYVGRFLPALGSSLNISVLGKVSCMLMFRDRRLYSAVPQSNEACCPKQWGFWS